MNQYRLFLRTLEKNMSKAQEELLHRLQAAWSAENMSAILDHFEEGVEKTGWSPHGTCDPSVLSALIQWMETCDRLPPPLPSPSLSHPLSPDPSPSPLVTGIVRMAQVFRSYSPGALTHLQKEAHAFEEHLENPDFNYAESRSRWG